MINFINGLNVVGDSTFADSITMLDVVNAGTDTNKFLVLSSSGVVNFRTGAELASDIGAGTGTVTGTGSAGKVSYWENSSQLGSSENFNWDSDNDRLGIGADPTETLHVKNTGNTIAKFETTATSDLAIQLSNSQGSMYYGLGGGEQFAVGTTSDLNGTGNLFIIEQGGNTGIGTTSPGSKLDVNGNMVVNSSGTDGGLEMGVWAQSSAYNFIGTKNMTGLEYAMITDGTNTFIGAGTSGSLKLRGPANDSSPQIVIDGSSVTVDDGATVGAGSIRAKYKSSDNSAGITSTFTVRNGNNSASLTFVIKDGVVTSVTSSDRRLKKNIKLIGKSPSGINIYEFQYKAKYAQNYGTGKFQGVMSDEVPWRAVSVDKGGYDMVDYSMIDVEFKKL